jgi:hypothetical protein
VRNNDTLQHQQNKWKMLSYRVYLFHSNICAVVNEFITRLPFRAWRWGYNTWVAFFLFLGHFFLWSSGCIPQMRDQGRIIPLQQIRPTHFEEQPSDYLQFPLRSIRNRGTIPDGPKPTTSWTMCNCRMQPNTVSAWRWRSTSLPQECEIVVHNTCAQDRSWLVEDDLGVHQCTE